uniref:hypothetical protein n=1 Tax=Arthrobacter sp. TaxID=1667 RepID=UPI00159EDEBB|nr:hypothetical protein [Arthrobacter sp.]
MARHQGHKPLAALRGQPGKFFDRRCAYFLTKNWPACPAGCCSLVLGPLHFISPATKKTRGRDKARGWFRDPPHPQIEENNHENTITATDGTQLSAETDVLLASKLADYEQGKGWDEGISPFDQHTILGEYLEFVGEFSN